MIDIYYKNIAGRVLSEILRRESTWSVDKIFKDKFGNYIWNENSNIEIVDIKQKEDGGLFLIINVDCEDCIKCRNCFRCKSCKKCLNVLYGVNCNHCKSCNDIENCQHCKGCNFCKGCKKCSFCSDCVGCSNCEDSYSLWNCNYCLGCGKSKYLFNCENVYKISYEENIK